MLPEIGTLRDIVLVTKYIYFDEDPLEVFLKRLEFAKRIVKFMLEYYEVESGEDFPVFVNDNSRIVILDGANVDNIVDKVLEVVDRRRIDLTNVDIDLPDLDVSVIVHKLYVARYDLFDVELFSEYTGVCEEDCPKLLDKLLQLFGSEVVMIHADYKESCPIHARVRIYNCALPILFQ